MMKNFNFKSQLTACLSVLLACTVYASCVSTKEQSDKGEIKALPYKILSDSLNLQLSQTEGKVHFVVDPVYFDDYATFPELKTSVNGVWKMLTPDAEGKFAYSVEPGNYAFQFYANDEFYEITIQKIRVEKQHDVTVKLMFYKKPKKVQVVAEKPVIYVYSDEEAPLTIDVDPTGEILFTYPQSNGNWKGTATKNGFRIGEKVYPYLFWEAGMNAEAIKWENTSVIGKDEVIAYLEQVCDKAGLNANERTDLITYWGPRMMKYENCEVLALTDNIESLFGDLNVSDNEFEVERLYVIFRETSIKQHRINLKQLRTFERTSKFILEWGGSEVLPDEHSKS